MSAQDDLGELKSLLRGLLVSNAKAMTVYDLQRDFKSQEGRDIPYRTYGYNTLLEFLCSVPDTVKIENPYSKNPIVTPVLTEKLSHVDALVQRQKVNVQRKGHRYVAPALRRSSVKVPEKPKIIIPHNLQEHLLRIVHETPEVRSRSYPRLYNNYEINPRFRFLIPYDIQMRNHDLAMRSQGLPLSVIKQMIHPEALHNYGINYGIEELLQNLGHHFLVQHGWVYPRRSAEHVCKYPIPQGHGANSNNFMPNWADRHDYNIKQSCDTRTSSVGSGRIRSPLGSPTGFQELRSVEMELQRNAAQQKTIDINSNKREFKPAGYENSLRNKDLHVVDEEENYEDRLSDESHSEALLTENGKNDNSCDTSHFYSKLMISNVMRENLQYLLEKKPDGIWCSELPNLYKEHFRLKLDYNSLGFVSVVEMTTSFPDIFHTVRVADGDWKVFDARKSLPQPKDENEPFIQDISPEVPTSIRQNIEKMLMCYPGGLLSDQFIEKYQNMYHKRINVQDFHFDTLESFLISLNGVSLHLRYLKEKMQIYPRVKESEPQIFDPVSNMTIDLSEFYPPDVMGPKDTIPKQTLPPGTGPGSYLEVLVAEVFNPSKFWVQLRGEKTHLVLDKVMNDMQEYYSQHEYEMPHETMLEGQYCAALFNGEWHRARIDGFPKGKSGPAMVFYIDYGTVKAIKQSDIRFLHKDFTSLPMQAIKSSLANIKPVGDRTTWEKSVSKRFLSLVFDKNLIALVSRIDYEKHELEVALVDTTQEEDIHINDLLKHEGLAEFITCERNGPRHLEQPQLNSPSPVKTEATPSSLLAEAATQPQQRVGLSVNRPPPGFAAVPVGSAEMPKIAPPTSVPSISVLTSSVQSMAITTPTVSMTSVMSQAPTLNVTTDASSQNQLFMQPQPCSMPPTANAPSIVNPLYNPLVANAGQYLPQSQFVNMQQPSQQQIALDLWKQQVMQSMMMNPFTAIMCNPQIAAAATNNQYALAAAAAAAATSNPYAMAAAAAATSNPFATAVATNNPFATAVATAAMMGNSINNPFGMSMVNPTMLYPQQVPNKTTNLGPLEVNISEVLSPVQGIEPSSLLFQSSSQNSNNSTTSEPVISTPPSPPTVPNSSGSSPITHLYQRVEVDANTLMIDNMNAACSTEPHTNIPIDSSKKAAESTSSSASNVLEQFDIVSVTKLDTRIENSEPEQESEPLTTIEDFECPAEIYRSDDEETDDAIVEKEIEEIIMNVKKLQHVKKVQLAKKTTHIVNIKSVPHLCTDELVRIFTEFSGRHVIVKILDAKNVSLPFRDISRSEEPEVFKALDLEEVVGVPKVDGIIVGRLNVTPLQALPQLMTMLSMQNREIFRAAHEEIERYTSQPSSYWMQ